MAEGENGGAEIDLTVLGAIRHRRATAAGWYFTVQAAGAERSAAMRLTARATSGVGMVGFPSKAVRGSVAPATLPAKHSGLR